MHIDSLLADNLSCYIVPLRVYQKEVAKGNSALQLNNAVTALIFSPEQMVAGFVGDGSKGCSMFCEAWVDRLGSKSSVDMHRVGVVPSTTEFADAVTHKLAHYNMWPLIIIY